MHLADVDFAATRNAQLGDTYRSCQGGPGVQMHQSGLAVNNTRAVDIIHTRVNRNNSL